MLVVMDTQLTSSCCCFYTHKIYQVLVISMILLFDTVDILEWSGGSSVNVCTVFLSLCLLRVCVLLSLCRWRYSAVRGLV